MTADCGDAFFTAKRVVDMNRLAGVSVWLDAFGVPNTIYPRAQVLAFRTPEGGSERVEMGDWVVKDEHGFRRVSNEDATWAKAWRGDPDTGSDE